MRGKWIVSAMALAVPAMVAMAQPAEGPVVLHRLMLETVIPNGNVVAALGAQAIDRNGVPDSARLTAADWERLSASARAIREAAVTLADARQLVVALPEDRLVAEGAPGSAPREQIQQGIDQDRQGFSERAQGLVQALDGLLAAAATKDAVRVVDASGRVDEACQACHTHFWPAGGVPPVQPALPQP